MVSAWEARSIARSRIRNERARGRKYLTGFYLVWSANDLLSRGVTGERERAAANAVNPFAKESEFHGGPEFNQNVTPRVNFRPDDSRWRTGDFSWKRAIPPRNFTRNSSARFFRTDEDGTPPSFPPLFFSIPFDSIHHQHSIARKNCVLLRHKFEREI